MQYRWLILLCCYIMFTAFSCDEGINYDATIKYHVHGMIANVNGDPIPDVDVKLYGLGGEGNAVINCSETSVDGEFEFLTSSIGSSATMVSVNDVTSLPFYCTDERVENMTYHRTFFNNESYEDFELEVNITLVESVPLYLINPSEDRRVNYILDHLGIDRLNDTEDSFIEKLQRLEKVVHYVAPNQTVRLKTFGLVAMDTLIEVGMDTLLFEIPVM